MASTILEKVQSEVRNFEGFDIRLSSEDSANKKRLPKYDFQRIARNSMTVEKYVELRIETLYPGIKVEVLLSNGKPAKKSTLLSSIRSKYEIQSDN